MTAADAAVTVEKTEEKLRKEIEELHRQQREISERLRDPRGLRRGGFSGSGPRNFASNGLRQRGFVRPAERIESENQPPAKRRLSSAVVKIEDGEIIADTSTNVKDLANKEEDMVGKNSEILVATYHGERNVSNLSGRDANQRPSRMEFEVPPAEHVPRVLPKNEDPSLVKRNKRMLGQLLGTLARFREEDVQLSGSEAYMRRSDSLKRAEERAREESEKLRQQEREQIAEKRTRDMTLRARVAAKAEEKKLELLFLRWSDHQRKLGNFIRLFPILVQKTKSEPPIYYMYSKPMDEDNTLLEQQKEEKFQEWKTIRREELSQYQKHLAEQYVANVEKEMERWQYGRRGRMLNNEVTNLQETMDKELETHRLEHGPKTRKIPGGSNNKDEDDVEDINIGEDDVEDINDMIEDVLDVDESTRRGDETVKAEVGDGSQPETKD